MTFSGHAIPAAFFMGFGMLILCHTLYQAHHLPPGSSLSNHVIDRKHSFLRKIAFMTLLSTSIGIIFEGCNGRFNITGDYGSNFFHEIVHQTLYFTFSFSSLVMILESCCRLPANSSRAAISLSFLVEYILWDGHAHMKYGTLLTIHVLLAQVCLVSCVVFLYMTKYPSSMPAFVLGFALMLLQGTWLLHAGFNELGGAYEMGMHQVGSFFCLHVLAIGFVVIIATSCVYRKLEGEGGMIRGKSGGEQYARVAISAAADENGEVEMGTEFI